MRHLLSLLAFVAAAAAASGAPLQGAADYPSRPVRLVVPFAPGGTNDVIGRILAEKLATRLGQAVVVDNRPGANSVVGAEIVAKAAPDGHTLLIVAAGFAVNPSLRKTLPYDTVRDFAPLGLVGSGPYLLVVHPSVPAKDLGELVTWAKSRAGAVSYASTGTGSPPHLAAELLRIAAGIEMQHVPYKGGGQVLPDLLAGRVSLFFGSVSTLAAHVQAGRLRAIAVTTTRRAPSLPDVPTVIESGIAGYEVNGWYGLLAPARTPGAIVRRLNAELRAALDERDTRARLAQRGIEPQTGSPEEFAALIRDEIAKWAKVVRAAGIQAD